jgi:hypothetical protein
MTRMRYTVVSTADADDQLAATYNQAPDKAAVTAASNAIDQYLKDDAHRKGLSRYGDRTLTIAPLTVVFTVSPDDRLVVIREYHYTP